MNGEEPSVCSTCFDRERVTGVSNRIHRLRNFQNTIDNVSSTTLPDGTCTEMQLKYWDFRFSNLCNFKCRSCGPKYSSSWIPDAVKLGRSTSDSKVTQVSSIYDINTYEFLESQIEYVERIYFAGGEPLLMAEHWQILKLLFKRKKFDVEIMYNTNCSTLTFGGEHAIDYWKHWQFKKLDISASIDEIGVRAELIRSGTNWKKVEANLITITKHENIIIRPSITVGAWNVFRLPEILTHLVDIGVIKHYENLAKYTNFHLNLLQYPSHYHVSILPNEYKDEIIIKLTNFISEFNSMYETEIDSMFLQIFHELSKPFDETAAKSFIKLSTTLDNVRNENIFTIIPELNVIKEYIDN
jgi:organic radical activating enzyme